MPCQVGQYVNRLLVVGIMTLFYQKKVLEIVHLFGHQISVPVGKGPLWPLTFTKLKIRVSINLFEALFLRHMQCHCFFKQARINKAFDICEDGRSEVSRGTPFTLA